MKLHYLRIIYLFVLLLSMINTLQLNYFNIFSMEYFISMEKAMWTVLVPILCLQPSQ